MIQELRSTVESGSRKNNAKAVIARVPAPAYSSADPMPRRTATAPQAALPILKASARVPQKRRTLTVQRTGVFEDKYEPVGFGSETDIKDTRAQDEHIKNLLVGQMEILMTDNRLGTLHSHLHVKVPRHYRFPGLEARIYPRLHAVSHVEGANLRFKDPEVVRRNGRLATHTGRSTWM